jgi:metal-sulfur cluster biosynthetic enzyme
MFTNSGLIYDIKIYPVKQRVHPDDPDFAGLSVGGQHSGRSRKEVRKVEGVNDVQVELTFDPPYSQDMMSEVANWNWDSCKPGSDLQDERINRIDYALNKVLRLI